MIDAFNNLVIMLRETVFGQFLTTKMTKNTYGHSDNNGTLFLED